MKNTISMLSLMAFSVLNIFADDFKLPKPILENSSYASLYLMNGYYLNNRKYSLEHYSDNVKSVETSDSYTEFDDRGRLFISSIPQTEKSVYTYKENADASAHTVCTVQVYKFQANKWVPAYSYKKTYNDNGMLTSIINGKDTTLVTYTKSNLIDTEYSSKTGMTKYEYSSDGIIAKQYDKSNPGNSMVRNTYDRFGFISNNTSDPSNAITYTTFADGSLNTMITSHSVSVYNEQGKLTEKTQNSGVYKGAKETYQYDSKGNILGSNINNVKSVYQYNKGVLSSCISMNDKGQIMQTSDYDAYGNLKTTKRYVDGKLVADLSNKYTYFK